MRKILLLGTAFALALTSTAWAGAKDKTSNTLVDRNAAGIIDNTTAKTKIKSKGCKTQIQAQPVALADGDLVICILEADASVPGLSVLAGNSIVVTGEAKKGKLKIKADLSEAELAPGVGCGLFETLSWNGQLKCYLDNALYRSDAVGAGTWRDGCTSMGMTAGSAPGTTMNKVNSGVPIVVGLCQGSALGDRILPPVTTEWALTGQRTAVIP